jgi:hypothetical protein
MKSFSLKHGLILSAILLLGLGLLFAQRLVFPETIRLIVAAVLVFAAFSGFFAWARPARPFAFALAASLLATVEAWGVFLGLHALLIKDLDAPGMLVNHLYLNGLITVVPFILAAQSIAVRPRSAP